ncbi:MAG: hypothetical protein B6U75_04265 [Desulfurococcales archaeon ex4484_217_1]|nr:MAG: hypothetical protein B6U75_04265 [Desulfurococcales archaeon ex4484_217_1]
MGIKAVFFDIGGTLYKEKKFKTPPWALALANYLKRYGMSLSWSKIYQAYVSTKEYIETLNIEGIEVWHLNILLLTFSKLNLSLKPSLIMEAYHVFLNSIVNIMEPYEDARSTLKHLKEKKLKVGIISNTGSHYLIYEVLKRDGLLKYVDLLVTSQMVSWRKPDRRIFLYACYSLNVEPSECVHIGNDPVADVMGAKNAGLKAVQKLTPYTSKSDLADAVIFDLGELINVIENL